jgi:spore maturation protein CgeB
MIFLLNAGFNHCGLENLILNSFDGVEDRDDQIFIICDNFYDNRRPDFLDILDSLANKYDKTTWLMWSFHNIIENHYLTRAFPFKKYIFTGEYYRKPNIDVLGNQFKKYIEHPNYVCLPFAASIHPKDIDSFIFKRTDIYDAGFLGAPYKTEWLNNLKNNFNCYIHHYPPYLSNEERIQKAFLDSKICLAFNADTNINLGLPTERTFEGLAYGCVVLSDTKITVEITDGIVEFVNSYDELSDKVKFYSQNNSARLEKQKLGIKYAKEKGTYFHVAQNFINEIIKKF